MQRIRLQERPWITPSELWFQNASIVARSIIESCHRIADLGGGEQPCLLKTMNFQTAVVAEYPIPVERVNR